MKKNISTSVDLKNPTALQLDFFNEFLATATDKSKIVFIGEKVDGPIWDAFINYMKCHNLKPFIFLKSDDGENEDLNIRVPKLSNVKIPFVHYFSIDEHSYMTVQRDNLTGYINNKDTAAYAAKVARLLISIAF